MKYNISLILLFLCLLTAGEKTIAKTDSSRKKTSGEMVLIPGGKFVPFFEDGQKKKPVSVDQFLLDKYPVTNREFLKFVTANPKWRKSQVKKIFADDSYLNQWQSDLLPGSSVELDAPVTMVSWFAARAYAQWKGKRLPVLNEWEYAARASFNSPDGLQEAGFKQQILDWYSKPAPGRLRPVGESRANYFGVYDMHGLVWEWVDDFSSVLVGTQTDGNTDRNLYCGSGSIKTTDPGDYAAFLRYALRSSLKANYSVHNLGFRCAKDAVKK